MGEFLRLHMEDVFTGGALILPRRGKGERGVGAFPFCSDFSVSCSLLTVANLDAAFLSTTPARDDLDPLYFLAHGLIEGGVG